MYYEMLGSGITGTVPKVYVVINGWAFGMSTPMNTGFPASECVDGNVDLNFLVAARVMADGAPNWREPKDVSEWDWQGTVLYAGPDGELTPDELNAAIAEQNSFVRAITASLKIINEGASAVRDNPATRWSAIEPKDGFRAFP